MNKRVYLLMTISFVVGLVELIMGGILDLIAIDLHVTLGKVGYLISIFSLVYAIFGPLLFVVTSKIERKQLLFIFLLIFFLSNAWTVFSPTYAVLFMARVLAALSGSLLVVLCLVMAPNIVQPRYRARAIGRITMSFGASIVLGLPIGVVLGEAFNWRAPFLLIAMLTLVCVVGVHFLMHRSTPRPPVPLKRQLATLKDRKISFAHITMFFFLAGHTALYAYLKPFLNMTMQLEGTWVSMIYFLFGFAAVSGGAFGGTVADRLGARQTVLGTIAIFGTTLFVIPFTTFFVPLFLFVLVAWGISNWALTPSLQSYLIEVAPETSDVHQGLNNSAFHFGLAFGSFVGAIVIEHASVIQNAIVGGVLAIFALGAALISIVGKTAPTYKLYENEYS